MMRLCEQSARVYVLILFLFVFIPDLGKAASSESPCNESSGTLLEQVVKVSGLDASAKRPKRDLLEGDLYGIRLGDKTIQRLTDGQKLKSPIFVGDEYLLAIQGDRIVRVGIDGNLRANPEHVIDLPGVFRLAGLVADDPKLLVAIVERNNEHFPVVLCLDVMRTSRLTEVGLAHGDNEILLRTLARLRWAERRYGRVLLRDRGNNEGGGDVLMVERGKTRGLTDCRVDFCSQGTLSPNEKVVVFVRTVIGLGDY